MGNNPFHTQPNTRRDDTMTQKQSLKHLTLSALTLALLAACGGGGGGTTSSSAGGSTATVTNPAGSGTVTGFGSVIVDGVRYDDSALDSSGAIQIEDNNGTLRIGSRDDLGLGQKVEIAFRDANVMTRLTLGSELVGLVTGTLTGNTLSVAGQRVVVNTDAAAGPVTFLQDIASLSALTTSDRVEVYGTLATDSLGNYIQARRIERKPLLDDSGAAITQTKLTGLISELTTSGSNKTFKLGGITVTVPSTATLNPAGLTLVNGMPVKVFSSQNIAGNALTADSVRSKSVRGNSDDFRISGVVTDVNSTAKTFKVDGTLVNGSALGTLPAEGTVVRVEGRYDSAAQTVVAREVKNNKSELGDASLKGSIANYISNASFTVRGVPVDASAVSGLTGLANGVFVEVKGTVLNGTVKASSVETQSPTTGARLERTGNVSALNTAAQTFQLGTQLVNYSTAVFEDGTASNLADGAVVEVEGALNNSTLQARKIEFKSASGEREVEGVLRSNAVADGSKFRFTVGSTNLVCTPSSSLSNCSANTLKTGTKVDAKYTVSGSDNVVTRLKVKAR